MVVVRLHHVGRLRRRVVLHKGRAAELVAEIFVVELGLGFAALADFAKHEHDDEDEHAEGSEATCDSAHDGAGGDSTCGGET